MAHAKNNLINASNPSFTSAAKAAQFNPTNPANPFPPPAVAYCHGLWQQHGFQFTVARARRTRLGDYRHSPLTGHRISVNGNLNSYAFLFTYLHEVAHLLTQHQCGGRRGRVRPHGKEWKLNFQRLMEPVFAAPVFPPDLRTVLQRHLANPAATTAGDPALLIAFRRYDEVVADHRMLSELQPGETFRLGSRTFVKEITRRTRALCREVATGRKYTVPEVASVVTITEDQ
ncbi:MAG: hypothetical protein H7Z75_18795 [Ferruginibacter sp.]|nr:hypothetical protein [Cytophagales bacterium]